MTIRNIILVRTPRKLIIDGYIGYGWKDINFSKYTDVTKLIADMRTKYNLGRTTNQIKRFFNLKQGDIVIIPCSRSIVIAKVIGDKSYEPHTQIIHTQNRINVKPFSDNNGNIFIPRTALSSALQSRLKIRMSVTNLNEFSSEIDKQISALDKGEMFARKQEIEEKVAKAEDVFKSEMLNRLRTGKNITIAAGGYGLEVLVKELLEIMGYDVHIQAKNASSHISDVDVIASRINGLTGDKEGIFIQVKHHEGLTGEHGLKQLDAYEISKDEYSCYKKALITTAELSEQAKTNAENMGIVVIEGDKLVDLIYEYINELSDATKTDLGIMSVPALI